MGWQEWKLEARESIREAFRMFEICNDKHLRKQQKERSGTSKKTWVSAS